jgi:4-hydroxy-L-threonine phosphate dehydrogenase PdxA
MLIGITLGDVTGIGPEVTLKALAKEAASDQARYLIIGDAAWVRRTNEQLQLKLPLKIIATNIPPRAFPFTIRLLNHCPPTWSPVHRRRHGRRWPG